MIHQRRDLGIRIDADETGTELVAFADLDQPRIIICALVAGSQQFFQHDGDLLAVRRRQRIKLQRVLADGQFLLMGGTGDRTVDIGELAAIALIPGPDLGHFISGGEIICGGIFGHEKLSLCVSGGHPEIRAPEHPYSKVAEAFFQPCSKSERNGVVFLPAGFDALVAQRREGAGDAAA